MTAFPGAVRDADGLVDAEHPWPGPSSFTESQQTFFHGRSAEIEDLNRRVRRKPLTVLYGQSGLGKTSLLQAGLFPRLRNQGFLPVQIRITYGTESGAPSEQVRRALLEALSAANVTAEPAFYEPQGLWESLHRVTGGFRSAAGAPVTPVLVFDQFEELFIHGAPRLDGVTLVRAFVDELGALIENRAPARLEARLEADPDLVEAFDFERQDYRILISLREDYLAHLYDFRRVIPSVTENSMWLTRMNGEQALAAVTHPAPDLVSAPVAQAIVRVVAGAREEQPNRSSQQGAEFRALEVEPSLLSLFCRGLNQRRLARSLKTITADLVQGNRETILREYYEGCLEGLAPGVRTFVEEDLVTEEGFRETVTIERAARALALHGAPPESLERLVQRRLLHVEERLGVRRIELTHDVLAVVAKHSRATRRQADTLAKAEREAEEARARFAISRRRNFAIIAGSALGLSVLAVLLAFAIRSRSVATTERVKADSTSRALAVEKTKAEARAADVERLYHELSDSAKALSGQRDTLRGKQRALEVALARQEGLRRQADSSSARAISMQEVATRNLQQLCDYSSALSDTLLAIVSPVRTERDSTGRSQQGPAVDVYDAYLRLTKNRFERMYLTDTASPCIQQLRARASVGLVADARERNLGVNRVRTLGREALPLVDLLARAKTSDSRHLGQQLYTDLAYYFWLVDDTATTELAARSGIKLSTELDASKNANTLYNYGRLYQMLGSSFLDRRWLDSADAALGRSLAIVDSGLRRSDQYSVALLLSQSQVLLRRAVIDTFKHQPSAAQAEMEKAVESARRRSRTPTVSSLDWLASMQEWQADFAVAAKDSVRAHQAYLASRTTRGDSLLRSASGPAYRRSEQQLLRKSAQFELQVMHDTATAIQLLRQQVRVDSAVIAMGRTRATLETAGTTLERLGRVARATGHFKESAVYRRQEAAIRGQIFASAPDSASRAGLSTSLGNLAFSQLLSGDPAAALSNALEGLRVDSTQTYILSNLAPAYLLTGRLKEAEALYRDNATRHLNTDNLFADTAVEDAKLYLAIKIMTAEQVASVCRWVGRQC